MKIIKGIAGSPGIVKGKLIYFQKNSVSEKAKDIDEAVSMALREVRSLKEKTKTNFGDDNAKIFSAYEMLLEDSMLTDPIKSMVDSGENPQDAVLGFTDKMASMLDANENEYARQRAEDIRYIGKMLIDALNGEFGHFSFPDNDEKYILAARELTPVDTMLFDHSRLLGFATEAGGATSHTVILAKSMGIPAVTGLFGLENLSSDEACLDGYTGTLVMEPDEENRQKYEKLLLEEAELSKKLSEIKNSDCATKDGKRISVCINIGKPSDLKAAEGQKFDGVGLFRSEFLYSSTAKKPDVREQTEAYKKVIDAVYPNSVTIRTLDAGGDKKLSYLNMKDEENPFLGCRGIRLCLNNQEIFAEQAEAILLAGAGKKVKIMLPMITSVSEIEKAREIIDNVKNDLDKKGAEYCKNVSLGIMIETPASAIMAEAFAKRCDFFSIGTNDLVQYITAADRGNSDVENVYNPYHPAVVRTVYNVIQAGAKENIEVSVCGDMAANTDFTVLLLGMGLKKFSVPAPMVSRIKQKISSVTEAEAKNIAQKVLSCETETEVMNILRGEK